MKIKMLIAAFAILIGNSFVGAQESGASQETISVPTVKCNLCVKTVKSAIQKLDGIQDIAIDKTAKVAIVKFDNKLVSLSDIERAIARSGYDANDTKRDKMAYEKLDACCQ